MIVRLLVIVSALVVIAGWVARWWFWGRTKARGRRVECSMSVAELYERVGLPKRKANDFRDAAALGSALRDAGLKLLEKDGYALAKKRRFGWWNLKVLPPLVALIYVFALFAGGGKAQWVLGLGCFAVAVHVMLRVSGIRVELQAVKRGREALEANGGFRRMDEEEAVLRCARASVWDTVLPW